MKLIAFPSTELTEFAQAMPDEHRHADVVRAYRSFYRATKLDKATWHEPAVPPTWLAR